MTASPRIEIRPSAPGDLGAVALLLSERDEHALDPAAVSTALFGLEPQQLAGWIAFVDGEPAGFTCLYLRQQRWGGKNIRAGYWAHLFVREKFRRLMIYPQLVMAKMRGIKGIGIDAIFTGTRRPHVAEGHVKLGFARVDIVPVLIKPLRPFRLLARYRNWPMAAQTLAAPGDALYGAYLNLRRRKASDDLSIRAIDLGDSDMDRIADLLNASGAERISQVWSAQSLRRRLAGTIDGTRYTILLAERAGHPAGALIHRLAKRQDVACGVIMDIVNSIHEPHAATALLTEAEIQLRAAGADTTLFLDGLGAPASDLFKAAGHRVSSEMYHLLAWPKTLVSEGSPAADLANWRFSFLDHDAF